jgi:effector-binding domain-containing protein
MFEVIKDYALLIAFGLASPFGINLGTEQPKYRDIETLDGGVEIREYAKRIAAEVRVDAQDPEQARSEGFNALAGYIFGKNRQKQSISMTSPVEIVANGRSIAMTSPVEVSGRGDLMTMRFFMPANYSMADLPQPTDGRVKIVEVPKVTVAALRYSGSTKGTIIEAKTMALMDRLKPSQWNVVGPPKAFFCNPPWTIPFLRRNEVMVEVDR